MTNFTMPNNISSMNYALKLFPGLAEVEVRHGNGDVSINPAPGSGSKKQPRHFDQYGKLKGLDF